MSLQNFFVFIFYMTFFYLQSFILVHFFSNRLQVLHIAILESCIMQAAWNASFRGAMTSKDLLLYLVFKSVS